MEDADACTAEAGVSGVSRLLSLRAPDSEIVRAIRGELLSGERPRGTISPQARSIAERFSVPAKSSESILKLASYLQISSGDADPGQLARDIVANADAADEVLRIANGASVGLRCQITTVADAVKRLGEFRTLALLISSGLHAFEKTLLRGLPPGVRSWYQLRCSLNAAVTSVFARRTFELSGDTAYVLGRLQNLGVPILAATFGDRYIRLVDRATDGRPRPFARPRKRVF